jgi:hypothetical protein
MSLVNAARLRSIAATVRQLPGFYHFPTFAARYFKTVGEGAKCIREAERLGAFQGDSIYGLIGKELAHPRCHMDHDGPTPAGNMPAWRLPVWYAVVDTLAPALMRKRSRSMVTDANGNWSMLSDTSPEECEIVARAIEAEADRLEAESVEQKSSGQRNRGRGRKKADYETVQREAKLAAEWDQAHEAGTAKTDFAKGNQRELKALDAKYARQRKTATAMLDALLDRVAGRNRRSDN